jgi:hypothetical protein
MPEVDPDLPPSGRAGSAPEMASARPPQPPEKPPATVTMGGEPTLPPSGVVPSPPAGQNTPTTQDAGPPPLPAEGGSPWEVVPPPAPGASPTAAVQPPGSGPKTARFVSAEAAQSTLKLEEDGKLPELHLQDGEQKEKKEAKTTTVNPLVLFGVLAISAVLCAYLALLDPGSPKSDEKDSARRKIEENFFPREGEEALEYQEYLMMAQRANTRGDRVAERKAYERVLDLLRQERPAYGGEDDKEWSLTQDDERLKHWIAVLLSND